MISVSTDARVGLLGNPGDGYGGRVLAFTIADFTATVTAEADTNWGYGEREGSELLEAAVTCLSADGVALHQPARLSFTTTIPRQVGLAGSSAIVISAMRAALAVNDQALAPVRLARLALHAETEALGITAGPQDRVVQTYGGLLDMDFAIDWDPHSYHRLTLRAQGTQRKDPAKELPEGLFIAWDRETGDDSGQVHHDVRERWRAGDVAVRDAIGQFRRFATQGRAALDAGDIVTLASLMDDNYETRAKLWSIAPSDVEKIAIARRHGAGAKFCGSGGAVVGLLRDTAQLEALQTSYEQAGFSFVQPTLGSTKP